MCRMAQGAEPRGGSVVYRQDQTVGKTPRNGTWLLAAVLTIATWALWPHVPVKHWVFPTPLGSKHGLRVFAQSEAEAVEVLMRSTLLKP